MGDLEVGEEITCTDTACIRIADAVTHAATGREGHNPTQLVHRMQLTRPSDPTRGRPDIRISWLLSTSDCTGAGRDSTLGVSAANI
jgi:hypothetical protein